jgi:ABC-2 type transport system permease protein
MTTEIKPAVVSKNIASFLVFGGFTVAAFLFSHEIITYILEKVHLGVFLLHRFISMVLYVFFLSINVGNVIVAYASLYRSSETRFYLTKPISFANLFIIKFIDSFFYSSTTLLLVAAAVLAGYGTYFHLPWTFYAESLLFLFFPFMLLSAALGIIMLLLFMKLARVLGLRALLIGGVVCYIGVLYFYFSMTNPVGLVNSVMQYYPYVDRYFGFLDSPVVKYVPSHWFAESLYWTIMGNDRLAMVNAAILIVISATSLVAMVLLAKLLYYETWLTSMEMQALGESRASNSRLFSFSSRPRFLDHQTSVLIKKEFWQFFREPSQWIHLGIISMLVLVFIVSVRQVNLKLSQPFLQTVSYLVVYMFNAFLISSVALRFVYPMISAEGPAYWTIRSAPITERKFYWMKFLFAALPIVVLGEILVIESHQPLVQYHALIVIASSSLLFVMLALTGMNLSFGAYFSDFKDSSPIKVASSQGATITFLFTVLLLIALVAILVLPLLRYFDEVMRRMEVYYGILYQALLLIIVISLGVMLLSMVIGMKALRRDL